MQSKKGSAAANVGSAATDNAIYNREATSSRRMTQRIRDSVDLRRQSRSSLTSETRRSNSISCVTRQASGDDCAKQRFIVWAAVKRNGSVRMAASDRLRCPLLRCGEQFDDHEIMLLHLNGCRHLEAGEYLCYECMRVERFNDGKCKCCLGHQTKRRRIINAAKKVFSTLGHKPQRDGSHEIDQDDFAILPPPSYESLDVEQVLSLPLEQEISGTPISEMDAMPALPVELGSVNYERQHEDPRLVGEDNSFLPVAPRFVNPRPPFHALQGLQNANGARPSLTLDTHNASQPSKVPRTKYLSPSSSLRSTNSSQGVISPISAGSGHWTHRSTIDATLTSPNTPFSSDVESASLSRENSCKFPKDYPIPSFLSNWNGESDTTNVLSNMGFAGSNDDYTLNDVSELPGDIPLDASVPRSWGSDHLLLSFAAKENCSWSSTIDTEVNVLFTGDSVPRDVEDEAPAYDTVSLVGHTWDILQQQMQYSMSNAKNVNNYLARQLGTLSSKDIIHRGLASLQSILGGVDPAHPLDYLCFVHVIYAFSVVIHEEDVKSRLGKLFKQALAYRAFLRTTRDREAYSAVVAAIWQPRSSENPDTLQGRPSNLKGKDPELRANSDSPLRIDALIDMAQNFLDDLEMSVLGESGTTRPMEVLGSELYMTHVAESGPNTRSAPDAFSITVGYMVQMLSQKLGAFGDDVRPKLKAVGQRVASGYITTVRRLELELLQCGKLTLPAPELFDDFIPEVRGLCDSIYGQQGSNSRAKYHQLGVALVESLMQNFGSSNAPIPNVGSSSQEHGASDFDLDIADESDALADFLKDFDNGVFGAEDFPLPPEIALEDIITSASIPTAGMVEPAMARRPATDHTTVDPASLSRTGSDTEGIQPAGKNNRAVYTPDYTAQDAMPSIAPTPLPIHSDVADSPSATEGSASGPKAEANDCCELCGYRPKGDPQWFKGSMAKHKKLQHSTEPPRIFKCAYPGCNSAYKNRPDNLRQHQLEKGHFVDGEGKQKKLGKRKKMDEDQ